MAWTTYSCEGYVHERLALSGGLCIIIKLVAGSVTDVADI